MQEPDVGLDPGALGSCPEPKTDAQPLSHLGAPPSGFLKWYYLCHFFKNMPTTGYPVVATLVATISTNDPTE